MKKTRALADNQEMDVGKQVFVPMSDAILNGDAAVNGRLVPFNPEFLVAREDRKPANWIVPSNFHEARQRLRANRE